MSYDARDVLLAGPSTNVTCATGGGHTDAGDNDVDFGMSPALEVSDFISNTATKVRSIATNFNGLTHAVRADSIYYIGEVSISGSEILVFDISVTPQGETMPLEVKLKREFFSN